AIDLNVVGADRGAGRCRGLRRAVVAQGTAGHADPPEARVVDHFDHAAPLHVLVVQDLIEIAHGGRRYTVSAGSGEDLGAGQVGRPGFDDRVGLGHVLHALGVGGEARVVWQLRTAHGPGQTAPMLLVGADDGEPPVLAGVDVVGRNGQAAVTVAGAAQRPIRI